MERAGFSIGSNAAHELDTTDYAAGTVAALAMHCIAEQKLERRIGEIDFFRPLHTALYEAARELPDEAPAKPGMLAPAREGAAARAWHIYRQMMLDQPSPPRSAFHSVLFRSLAQQPDIRMLIAPPETPSDCRPQTSLPVAVLGRIRGAVTKGLDIFLNSHKEYTDGFEEWATRRGLFGVEQVGRRGPIEQALCTLLLGASQGDYCAKPSRTLIRWVQNGWRIRDRNTGNLISLEGILLQALVGPSLSPKGRARGALRQGLISDFFLRCYGLPLLIDREVPIVVCRQTPKPAECLLSWPAGKLICEYCKLPVDDGGHDMLRRRNIDVLGPVMRMQPGWKEHVPALPDTTDPVWAEYELAVCPAEREIETALAVAVLRDLAEDDLPALHALTQQRPTVPRRRPHQRSLCITLEQLNELRCDVRPDDRAPSTHRRKALRELGARLETVRKVVQPALKRLRAGLSSSEAGSAIARLSQLGIAIAPELGATVVRVVERAAIHCSKLNDGEQHLVFSPGAQCDRTYQAAEGTHGRASIRPITVYTRVAVQGGSISYAPASPAPSDPEDIEIKYGLLLDEAAPNLSRAGRVFLRTLGEPPARRLVTLLEECRDSAGCLSPQERLERTPTLRAIWCSLGADEKACFPDMRALAEAAEELAMTMLGNPSGNTNSLSTPRALAEDRLSIVKEEHLG